MKRLFIYTGLALLSISAYSCIDELFNPEPGPGTIVLQQGACVPDVIDQFAGLKHHGEALGFSIGVGEDPQLETDHYQAIARYNDPVDGTPYLYMTTGPDDNEGGDLLVVEMASRGRDGERFRSNRLQRGLWTQDTAPPECDRGVTNLHFDGSSLPYFNDVCGVQITGDILAVALGDRHGDVFGQGVGAFVLFNLGGPNGPEHPELIYTKSLNHKAGTIGITKWREGRYLVVIGGIDGKQLRFFESNKADVLDTGLEFTEIDVWYVDELPKGNSHTGYSSFQTLNFVNQCDGELFLIGMRHWPGWETESGDDFADLYRVTRNGTDFKLEWIGSDYKMHCVYDGPGRICNFIAASGVYVSPGGELILYASEHENGGPVDEGGEATVRMAEFRHRDGNHTGTCTRTTGWVELYEGRDFDGRSVVLDWLDRDRDDFDNLEELDGFDKRASSVRWCAPAGCNIVLYEAPCYAGDFRILEGTGSVREVPDLQEWGFDDRAGSIRFVSQLIADAGPDRTVSAGPECTASVELDGSASYGLDGDTLIHSWSWNGGSASGVKPTVQLPVGTTEIALVVSDGVYISEPDTVVITVIDDVPPAMSLSVDRKILWPPNHRMVLVTITASASDNCDPAPVCRIISVVSNEPEDGSCGCHKKPDWEITGDLTVKLRAECSGRRKVRVYTIEVECTDSSGNSTRDSVNVYVPRCRRGKHHCGGDDQ